MLIGLWRNAFAYTVDETLIFEEKSVYFSSKWSIELNANGDNRSGTDAIHRRINTDVGVNRVVENKRIGYWFNGDVEFNFERDVNDTTESKTTTLNIHNFSISSIQGLNNYQMADVGLKFYLSGQKPFYTYVQGAIDWEYQKEETISVTETTSDENDGMEALVGYGLGYGKIVELDSYDKILIVQDKLLQVGIIKSKFSRSIIIQLLPLFRKSRDNTQMLIKVQKFLADNGLIDTGRFSLDMTKDILDALDESFNERQSGLDMRIGYFEEKRHKDSNPIQDLNGYLSAYIRYEKPIREKLQYFCQINGLYYVAKKQDDRKITANWLNAISSPLGTNLNAEIGLNFYFSKRLETEINNISEEALVELDYEVTDDLTWSNRISYTMFQDNDPDSEDSYEYTATSILEYSIW
jgi:hypothetical protein